MGYRAAFVGAVCCAAVGCASNAPQGWGRGEIGALPREARGHVERLLARADARGLAFEDQWLRLGHYRRSDFGPGYLSEADGDGFFLAPEGRSDPAAELRATVRGFYTLPVARPRKRRPGEPAYLHPVCRFPARLAWLATRLRIDPRTLPVRSCPKFEAYWREIEPASVSIIFSSYYLNNPASAFGHTFLRFNKRKSRPGARQELLDYGIDFSADVDTSNAVIYAFKGLFGAFPGTFKRMPFFYKVREYNDHESRDMWEYELNFTPAQLALLVAHTWELGSTYFDYFYTSENCAYHILGLLEVGNPDLELVSRVDSPILPSETIKALQDETGFVKAVRFRPSLRTEFRNRLGPLSGAQRDFVLEALENPETPMPAGWTAREQVEVLDAAADLVDILHGKEIVQRQDAANAERKQRLLERRASIRIPSEPREVAIPEEEAPHIAHRGRRAGLGSALDDEGQAWLTVDYRLALHDLADPSPGYPELASIEFMSLRLSATLDENEPRARLEDLALIRILSLTSMDRYDPQFSWRAEAGLTTIDDEGCRACVAGRIIAGTGAALSLFDQALTVFTTVDGHAVFGPTLDGIGATGFRLGVGPQVGLRIRWHPRWITVATGHGVWLPGQSPTTTWEGRAVLRWQFAPPFALNLEGQARPDQAQAQALWMAYF